MSMQIGKVEDDGTVRGRLFTTIGKVDDDGTIRDANRMTIGRLPNVKKTWAAAAFFFFDFDMS
jgi:hypothetical protein